MLSVNAGAAFLFVTARHSLANGMAFGTLFKDAFVQHSHFEANAADGLSLYW